VLVVEDDLSLVRLTEAQLTTAGFRCSTAGSVGEAWRMVQDDPPDVAVVDIHLPGAFGWELVERIRTDQHLHRLPVVMVSAEVVAQDRDRARGLDAELLMKPFEAHELVEVIASLLQEKVRVPVRQIQLAIYLSNHRIEGTAHLPTEHDRFSDAWEAVINDKRSHLPLTDATIYRLDQDATAKAAFITVCKSRIEFVTPLEDTPSSGQPEAV
jgi:DNA-binding response OmpR family regulator